MTWAIDVQLPGKTIQNHMDSIITPSSTWGDRCPSTESAAALGPKLPRNDFHYEEFSSWLTDW